jgi:hypothetical protein
MKCSVSRSHEQAGKDDEWPGKDTRKWQQARIVWKKDGLSVETAAAARPSPKPAEEPADEPSASQPPLSPSLRRDANSRR